jgi:ferredoxin-NADP reductase
MRQETYQVNKRVEETADVVTLFLKRENGERTAFVPGQFITVYFPETGTPEGKSYSLSGAPREDFLKITVKSMGAFSNRLCKIQRGELLTASLPYGFFYTENSTSDLVFIAAGIGIAPFRGMILDLITHETQRKILLFYSNRMRKDIIFKKEFDDLQKNCTQLKIEYFLTREESRKRIDPKELVMGLPHLNSPEFLICGSISFVRDMWTGLCKAGVPQEVIYTEAFFSH